MRCEHCEAQNPDDAMFCGECGHRLGPQLPPAQDAPPPPPVAPPAPQPDAQGNYGTGAAGPAMPPPSAGQYVQHTNTSGSGPQAILPDEANGWTFAGCLPFGIFGFSHNVVGWGLVGCIGVLIPPLHWLYFFVMGASGKQIAWKHRRFADIESYRSTMQIWNIAGIAWMVITLLYWGLVTVASSLNPDSAASAFFRELQ
ncbi:zinc ribbon domain-containing protein [bacterium]|nr:zinc ribbon domain-containing protein [bacterium]